MFDDEKIKIVETMDNGYEYITIWVKLLCIAGKKNEGGCIFLVKELPLDQNMLARITGHNPDVFKSAIKLFEGLGMISIFDNGHLELNNWDKYQNKLKSYETVQEQNRIRQQAQRDKKAKEVQKKLGTDNQQVTASRDESRDVTHQEEKEEREKEENKEEEETALPIQNFSNLPPNPNSLSVGTKDIPSPSPSSAPLPPDVKSLGVKMFDLLRSKMRSEMDDILSRTELDLPTLSEMFAEYWIYNKGREFDAKNWKGVVSSFQKWFEVGGNKELPKKELSAGINARGVMEDIIEYVQKKKKIEISNDEIVELKKFLANTILTDEQLKIDVTKRFVNGNASTWKYWLRIAQEVQSEETYHRRLNSKL